MFRKLIEYFRWRNTEEGRQTRLYNRESCKLVRRFCKHYGTDGWNAEREACHIEHVKLWQKYPEALETKRVKREYRRPKGWTEEDWFRFLLEPVEQ